MGPNAGEQVRMTNLATNQTQIAEVEALDKTRLHLVVHSAVAPRELVKIEGPDWLALGEVVAFQPGPGPEGAPAAVIEVEHTLLNTGDLARRREAWLR
jgi:hypothetical protein